MQTNPFSIRKNKIYFIGLLASLLTAAVFLLANGKAAAFISLNSYHPFLLNIFFINYTFMGDGIFALCLVAVMFFYLKKKNQGFALLYSFLISGLAVQVIKNLISAPRPRLFFEQGQYLFFMDGISLANNSSFPSGHTATAFAIATVFVMMLKNKNWQWLILPAALLAGYSRIYLAQHFLLDVIIGAILGSVSGIIAVYLAFNPAGNRVLLKKIFKLIQGRPSSPASMQTV
ncbi:MAG: phosphatase PAP2 family protein [Ferruginibacter sp.]|nr:phosphatase PAP2 family protein [Chitinophagaceae bacterium]MBP6285486.1 phosphatase PAP2 family protein [Ferruginibacter sp.]MBU9935722.1 phosphatase PAP2 family protein [Ferruginibacter sp.]